MHTRAERKMLPYRQPARGAAARSASLELVAIPDYPPRMERFHSRWVVFTGAKLLQAPENEKSSISWGSLYWHKLETAPREMENLHLVGRNFLAEAKPAPREMENLHLVGRNFLAEAKPAPRKRKNIHHVGLFCRYKVRGAAAHYVSFNKRSYKLLRCGQIEFLACINEAGIVDFVFVELIDFRPSASVAKF